MNRDDNQITGWRKYKHSFTFGAAAKQEEDNQVDTHTPCTCEKEIIGCGCYQAVNDFELLDEN